MGTGRLNDLAQGKVEAPKIDPRIINIRKDFNYRDTTTPEAVAHIEWLKESIREFGVQKPIAVEYADGKVYLVDGECRLKAALALWKEKVEVLVPAIVVKGDEAEVRAKSMIANGALPPTQLEFGKAAAQLQAYGWDDGRIAAYTPPHIAQNRRRARQYVREAVELHQAPLAVKEAVQKGVDGIKVSPALAVTATRKNPLMAVEVIRGQVEKAKAAGKTEAHRPKGAGAKTRARQEESARVDSLLATGDRLAELCLSDHAEWEEIERVARRWKRVRG